ncbi:ribonuclease H-like domain-containing protein, partial [Tanacetum coccineum]
MHYRLPHPGQGILGPAPAIYASQHTTLPSAFSIMPPQDPTWHMDTGASSHLNFNEDTWLVIVISSFDVTALAISIQLPSHQLLPLLLSQQVPPRGINASDIRWPIHQLDVKNAFLNGDLSETVYMHQPPAFVDSRYPNHGSQIIDSLHKEFDMTDLEALNYFLVIFVVRHPIGLFLSQKKYARQLLERAHMVNCNPSRTPVDTDSKLGLNGVPVYDPSLQHSLARKRILRYIQGTLELGLQLCAFVTTSLVGYTD